MVEKKSIFSQEVKIPVEGGLLSGDLVIPETSSGLALFVHGSGSSRKSPRNQYVARYLQEENIATLLFDLLTPEEEEKDLQTTEYRFNIGLLAGRLLEVTKQIEKQAETKHLSIGYFGASTGAAAALIAAAKLKDKVSAVVSRGGRPDLAAAHLAHVTAPTLLIVGGNDYGVIELNEKALELLNCKKRLEIVEGATHLFEERGALERVSHLASLWLREHLM